MRRQERLLEVDQMLVRHRVALPRRWRARMAGAPQPRSDRVPYAYSGRQ